MGLSELLQTELQGGLPHVRGGRADMYLPIRQGVIDTVLRLLPGVPADMVVAIGPERRVQVRYGVFHVNARLHRSVAFVPGPVVVLELASQLVAWGLRSAPLPPFVRLNGRQMEVHLAEVPALRPVAALWRHVQGITFDSTPGQLDVRVAVEVT